MDYQYMYMNQIKTMDYWSLVNTLLTQITPQIRKCILDRLMEMNNQLMIAPSIIPNLQVDLASPPIKKTAGDVNRYKYNSEKEIDLDEIMDDLHINKPDDLDMELARIKNLRDKIIADKRRRKKESLKNNL